MRPDKCRDCVCFRDEIVTDKHGRWNCNPRGHRWWLLRKPDQDSCGTVQARLRDDGQQAMWGSR
jgi:hypothetical protein